MALEIRLLDAGDVSVIAAAFAAIGWDKPESQYARYLGEQAAGQRAVFVALEDGAFAGYVTVVWEPEYPPFRAEGIPEIQDFNVLPQFRRRGIGTRLLDAAEQKVTERSPVVGIGVGLDPDYGAAQRLYTQRGYVADGRGLFYGDHFVCYGEQVVVDHSLVLHFTKRLSADAD